MERRISRRDFLKLAPIAAAATETVILTGCNFREPEKDSESSYKIIELMKQNFGLRNFYFGGQVYVNNELTADGIPPPYGFQAATRVTSEIYRSFAFYPPELFENLKITPWNYMLAEDLKVKIDSNWYLVDGGMVGTKTEGFNICINNRNFESTSLTRDTTHHELFHLIASALLNPEIDIYPALRAINNKYGYPEYNESENFKQAASCKDPPDDPPEGFARCYGEWKPSEDAATIAAALMQSDPLFLQRIPKEPVLKEKTEIIKKTYEIVSNGKMNPAFFDWIAAFPNEVPWSWPLIPEEMLNP